MSHEATNDGPVEEDCGRQAERRLGQITTVKSYVADLGAHGGEQCLRLRVELYLVDAAEMGEQGLELLLVDAR